MDDAGWFAIDCEPGRKALFRIHRTSLKAVCFALALPLAGIFVAWFALGQLDERFDAAVTRAMEGAPGAGRLATVLSLAEICATPSTRNDLLGVCRERDALEFLAGLSVVTALAGLATLMAIIALARLAAARPDRLAASLRGTVVMSTVALFFLVPAQALIFILSVYGIEVALFGSFHPVVVGGVALALTLGLLALLFEALGFAESDPVHVAGQTVGRADQPALHALIDEVAEAVGMVPPDHIVIGLDPIIFATRVPVRELGKYISREGLTLFLSLPLLRLLDIRELRALVARELAGFAGENRPFASRFLPALYRLTRLVERLQTRRDANALKRLGYWPIAVLLDFCRLRFTVAAEAAGGEAEAAADREAAAVYGAAPLASALIRIAIAEPAWRWPTHLSGRSDEVVDAKRNISASFASRAMETIEETIGQAIDSQKIEQAIGEAAISHPQGRSTPLAERLAAFGAASEDVGVNEFARRRQSAVELVENYTAIEVELGALYIRQSFASRRSSVPRLSRALVRSLGQR